MRSVSPIRIKTLLPIDVFLISVTEHNICNNQATAIVVLCISFKMKQEKDVHKKHALKSSSFKSMESVKIVMHTLMQMKHKCLVFQMNVCKVNT